MRQIRVLGVGTCLRFAGAVPIGIVNLIVNFIELRSIKLTIPTSSAESAKPTHSPHRARASAIRNRDGEQDVECAGRVATRRGLQVVGSPRSAVSRPSTAGRSLVSIRCAVRRTLDRRLLVSWTACPPIRPPAGGPTDGLRPTAALKLNTNDAETGRARPPTARAFAQELPVGRAWLESDRAEGGLFVVHSLSYPLSPARTEPVDP